MKKNINLCLLILVLGIVGLTRTYFFRFQDDSKKVIRQLHNATCSTVLFFYNPRDIISQQLMSRLNQALINQKLIENKNKEGVWGVKEHPAFIMYGICCPDNSYDISPQGLQSFSSRYNPQFSLLKDEEGLLRSHYQVKKLPAVLFCMPQEQGDSKKILFEPSPNNHLILDSAPILSRLHDQFFTIIEELALYIKSIKKVAAANTALLTKKELSGHSAQNQATCNQVLSHNGHNHEPKPLWFPAALEFVRYQEQTFLAVAQPFSHCIYLLNLDSAPDAYNKRSSSIYCNNVEIYGTACAGFTDGNQKNVQFNGPSGLAYDPTSHILYCADRNNCAIRAIDLEKKEVVTVAGNGNWGHQIMVSSNEDPCKKELGIPVNICFFKNYGSLVIALAGTHQVWLYEVNYRRLRQLAGNGKCQQIDGQPPYNALMSPMGLCQHTTALIVSDIQSHALRMVPHNTIMTILDAKKPESIKNNMSQQDLEKNFPLLNYPAALCSDNSVIYIADSYNHRITSFDPATKELKILCGTGKPGLQLGDFECTEFNCPQGLALSFDKRQLFVADTNNHRIVILNLDTRTCKELVVLS